MKKKFMVPHQGFAILFSILFFLLFSSKHSSAQNALVGPGFSSGWGGGGCPTTNLNFTYLGATAGNTYIATRNPNGTGLQFFRFGVDWSGTTAQLTNTIGSDVTVVENTTYSLNTNCTTSGSLRINCPNTTDNYVFKTLNAGTNPAGTWVFFRVQGTVRTINSVSQSPTSLNVFPGQAVTVTAAMSGVQSTGQNVYLRYSTDNFATSTVVTMTYSGTSATATIPASVNKPSTAVRYYVFTSGTANVATNGSNADLYTINFNNNFGNNFSYTVAGGWTTNSNGDWGTASTWTANAVPPTSESMGLVGVIHNVTGNADALFSALNILGSSTLTLNSGRTHSTNGAVFVAGTASYVINGTFQIFTGGLVSGAGKTPFYSSGSTLVYNTGNTYNRSSEWPSGETPGTVPYHVKIAAYTTLNLDVTGSFNFEGRSCLGDLDIYGVLTMGGEGGTMAEDLKVGGSVYIRELATLTLGAQIPDGSLIGDIWVGGNWEHTTNGNFIPSRRAVWFVGSNAEQTVNFSGTERFAYFVVNKPGNGIVKMNCDAYVYGTNRGSNFQMLNGRLDLNGKNFTVSVRDSLNKDLINTTVDLNLNVLIDGSGSNLTREIINSSASPATFNFTHYDNVQHVSEVLRNVTNDPDRAALLSFGTNVMVTIGAPSANAGVNFGNTFTTINGTLRINNRGYVDINPPTYANNSLLQYNIGDVYNRNAEWKASSGPGYPFNVQTSLFGTRLIAGGSSNTGTVLNMAGSLTVDASTTVDMSNAGANIMSVPLIVGLDINLNGTLIASGNTLGNVQLGRNWTRNNTSGLFTHNTRRLIFNSALNSIINLTAAGTETFYAVETAKASAANTITLNKPVDISNAVYFGTGRVISSLTNLLTFNDNALAETPSDNSFVDGPVAKIGNDVFSFPVGKEIKTIATSIYNPAGLTGGYRPISISAPGSVTDIFTAEFFHRNSNLIGPVTSPGLQGVSACEYWGLKRQSTTDVAVTISWMPKSVCNPTNFIITTTGLVVAMSSDGTPLSHPSGQWNFHGGSAVGDAISGTVTWAAPLGVNYKSSASPGYAAYTPFTLGTINWQNSPLPFELKNFKAVGKDKDVQLTWLVNNNNQVNHYAIERSRDGVSFETFKKVYARSSEETASYSDLDPTPYTGWAYYRLRITDMSGQVQYSSVQKVWIGSNQTTILVTPKPAKNMLWVNLSKPEEVTELSIVSSVGQLILKQNRLQLNNQIDISRLQPGVYYVRLVGKSGIITEAFVKE